MNAPRFVTFSPAFPSLVLALLVSMSLHGLLIVPSLFVPSRPDHAGETSPSAGRPLAATLKQALPSSAPTPSLAPEQESVELELEMKTPSAPSLSAPPPKTTATTAPAPRPARPVIDVPLGTLPPQAARSARQQIAELARQEGFYPLEAIQNRWQGEAWVRIFLDAQGQVIAARIETSSGHAILDEAALRAARSLKSLPANGLEDATLPIQFRLRQGSGNREDSRP